MLCHAKSLLLMDGNMSVLHHDLNLPLCDFAFIVARSFRHSCGEGISLQYDASTSRYCIARVVWG